MAATVVVVRAMISSLICDCYPARIGERWRSVRTLSRDLPIVDRAVTISARSKSRSPASRCRLPRNSDHATPRRRGLLLVGKALLHQSCKHRLPAAPAIALLQEAMPRPGLPLVHFNDTRCGSVAELRSVILKARRLARDDAQRERAGVAVRAWRPAQIEKKRSAPTSDIVETASDEQFAPKSTRRLRATGL